MEEDKSDGQTFSMFFEKDFDPLLYTDALIQSIINEEDVMNSQVYNRKRMNNLSNKCSNLITHLDYYTNELSKELGNNLDSLKNATVPILSTEIQNSVDGYKQTTRFQYYINVLNNALLSFKLEVEGINNSFDAIDENTSNVFKNLNSLRVVKTNLKSVLRVFEAISRISDVTIDKEGSSLSIETFQDSLDMSFENISRSLSGDTNYERVDSTLIKEVDDVISLLPSFNELKIFYPVYKRFTSKLETSKDRYLSMRSKSTW